MATPSRSATRQLIRRPFTTFEIVAQSDSMKQKLKVSFDDPEHGWVGLTISHGEESLTIIASYTPSDSFLDLTNTLYNLLCYRIGGVVTWHEEPSETELRFSISGEQVKLEVYFFWDHRRDSGRGARELAITGSYGEICRPFWRALRSLQGRFSADELNARWHRPFPWKEIDVLTTIVKEKSGQSPDEGSDNAQ